MSEAAVLSAAIVLIPSSMDAESITKYMERSIGGGSDSAIRHRSFLARPGWCRMLPGIGDIVSGPGGGPQLLFVQLPHLLFEKEFLLTERGFQIV